VEGPSSIWGPAFQVTLRDVNIDGLLDAYVCNDSGATDPPNRLLLNDGDLRFTDAPGSDLEVTMFCMGASWGDADDDGDLDLYLAGAERQLLLMPTPDQAWVDMTAASGLGDRFNVGDMAWGSALSDVDNDGAIDLLVGMGDFWTATAARVDARHYRRDGDRFIRDDTSLPLPTATSQRGVLTHDLNGDGVLDVVFGDALRTPWVLESDGCSEGAWLEVQAPRGAEVRVEAEGTTRAALVTGEPGWGATGPAVAHIGLGDVTTVDRLALRLPNGEEVTLDGPFEPRRRVVWAP